MRGHFRHSIAAFECPHNHLLFDGGYIFLQAEFQGNVSFYSAKTVLGIAQFGLETPVNAFGNKRTAGQAQKFVKTAKKLT